MIIKTKSIIANKLVSKPVCKKIKSISEERALNFHSNAKEERKKIERKKEII